MDLVFIRKANEPTLQISADALDEHKALGWTEFVPNDDELKAYNRAQPKPAKPKADKDGGKQDGAKPEGAAGSEESQPGAGDAAGAEQAGGVQS